LLHLNVENILGHHTKTGLSLRRESRTGLVLRLRWGLALDGIHRCIDVHHLRLAIVEVDGCKLNLIDTRESGGVHLQRV
jgi:hypothetical protein